MGFLNRTGAEIGINLIKSEEKIFFISENIKKYRKCPALPGVSIGGSQRLICPLPLFLKEDLDRVCLSCLDAPPPWGQRASPPSTGSESDDPPESFTSATTSQGCQVLVAEKIPSSVLGKGKF